MSTYPYTKRRNDRNQSAERLVKIRKLLATRNLLLVTGWLFLEDGFIYFLKKSPTGGTWQSENIRPLETAVPIRRSKNLLRKCDDQVPKWTHRGGWQRVEPFSSSHDVWTGHNTRDEDAQSHQQLGGADRAAVGAKGHHRRGGCFTPGGAAACQCHCALSWRWQFE